MLKYLHCRHAALQFLRDYKLYLPLVAEAYAARSGPRTTKVDYEIQGSFAPDAPNFVDIWKALI